MTARTACHGLQVDTILYRFIEDKVLPGTGIDSDHWWRGFAQIVHDLSPKNAQLLAERDRLQSELDAWHSAHPGPVRDIPAYRKFLESIGLVEQMGDRKPENGRGSPEKVYEFAEMYEESLADFLKKGKLAD